MKTISKSIIPIKQTFYHLKNKKVIAWRNVLKDDLDFKAITSFCALGFMLDDDTFSSKIKVCKPAVEYQLNNQQEIIEVKNGWKWNYEPEERSFKNVLSEFTELFERIIHESTFEKSVLLPISGGLDSRTLIVPIPNRKNLTLASYEFENGILETCYGKKIAVHFDIPIFTQKIPKGYIWDTINKTAEQNECFTDFLHPRQVVALNNWKGLGETVLLGHWGDVLFDTHAESGHYSLDDQVNLLQKKILHKGGVELACDLWKHWGLRGSFMSSIFERLDFLYRGIEIDHPSARIRAFKSLYWAPRWTSVNLSLFSSLGKVIVPYYHDDMCKFICTVPERLLKGRKIQIEYIKKNLPFAATIPWEEYYPLNLNNYKWFNNPLYYPVRVIRKLNRITKTQLFSQSEKVIRNWELQFLGSINITRLKKHLTDNKSLLEFIPESISTNYINKFQKNPIKYAHPLSMLVTLALFFQRNNRE